MRKSKTSKLAIVLFVLIMIGLFVPLFLAGGIYVWSLDAPPIPNDYTIADLRSAGPEYAQSYEILLSLADEGGAEPNGAPAIGLSGRDIVMTGEICGIFKKDDCTNEMISQTLIIQAENIKQAWRNAEKGRSIIITLADYPEIADLTEPRLEADIDFTQNLKRLAQIFHFHICLQSELGNEKEAIAELLEVDSIFRKLGTNARTMIMKLVCYAGFIRNIQSVNHIANNPKTSPESIEFLKGYFPRLTDEQVSLRNAYIFEYLMFKNILDEGIYEELPIRAQKYILNKNPLLKRNSSLRLYRNSCARWLAASEELGESEGISYSVWPRFFSFLPGVSFEEDVKGVLVPGFPWYYTFYNPIGSMLIAIMQPGLEKVVALKQRVRIQEDLLEIVLNKRLGGEISMKARAYSDEYIIDVEKKMIFSPGPDGESYTKDDIKLPMNPDVLNPAQ